MDFVAYLGISARDIGRNVNLIKSFMKIAQKPLLLFLITNENQQSIPDTAGIYDGDLILGSSTNIETDLDPSIDLPNNALSFILG